MYIEKRVPIDTGLSEEVEQLFSRYSAYMSMLNYMLKQNPELEHTQLFNKKWDECVELYIQLEQKKEHCANMYRPQDENVNYNNYTFEFNTNTLLFTGETIN